MLPREQHTIRKIKSVTTKPIQDKPMSLRTKFFLTVTDDTSVDNFHWWVQQKYDKLEAENERLIIILFKHGTSTEDISTFCDIDLEKIDRILRGAVRNQ